SRSTAAIHGRVRSPGQHAAERNLAAASAPHLVGYTEQALVPSRPAGCEGKTRSVGRTALDGPGPALESHVRRLPLPQLVEELRRNRWPISHNVFGNRRELRGLPRAGQPAHTTRQIEVDFLGPEAWLCLSEAERPGQQSAADPGLRSLSFAAKSGLARLHGGLQLLRLFPKRSALAGGLSCRRPGARRSVRVHVVPGEQDVPQEYPLHRLPRSAYRPPEAREESSLHLLPPASARQIRRRNSSSPSHEFGRCAVRRMPYAADDLHGGRSAARSQ